MKNSKNPKVDGFIDRATNWQNEIKELRCILIECGLDEQIKWGKPCYASNGRNVVIIQPFKKFLALMFFKGTLLKDSKKILQSQGPNSQSALRIEFSNTSQVTKLKSVLKSYIQQAIEIEKAGLKMNFKKITERKIPQELQMCFDNDKAYQEAFESLTPGRQRGYLLHFSGAKQSKTRANRIEKCRAGIIEGKGFNER